MEPAQRLTMGQTSSDELLRNCSIMTRGDRMAVSVLISIPWASPWLRQSCLEPFYSLLDIPQPSERIAPPRCSPMAKERPLVQALKK